MEYTIHLGEDTLNELDKIVNDANIVIVPSGTPQ